MTAARLESPGWSGIRGAAWLAAGGAYVTLCWAAAASWAASNVSAPPATPPCAWSLADESAAMGSRDALLDDDDGDGIQGQECPVADSPIDAGLAWLARHQEPDGPWAADGFMRQDLSDDACAGASTVAGLDPTVTALAVAAFVENGHTHRYGRYRAVVKEGARWLLGRHDRDGWVAAGRVPSIYEEAIVADALSGLYDHSKSPVVAAGARRAIARVLARRNAGAAWSSGANGGRGNLLVTGWCMLAISVAVAGDLRVPGIPEARREALRWVDSITDARTEVTSASDGLGPDCVDTRTHSLGAPSGDEVRSPLDSMPAGRLPTAIATVCRIAAGCRPNTDETLAKGLADLARWADATDDPTTGSPDGHYRFFAAAALRGAGLAVWKPFRLNADRAWSAGQQRDATSAYGSWDPAGPWGKAGGRVYATAMNALALGCIAHRYGGGFH